MVNEKCFTGDDIKSAVNRDLTDLENKITDDLNDKDVESILNKIEDNSDVELAASQARQSLKPQYEVIEIIGSFKRGKKRFRARSNRKSKSRSGSRCRCTRRGSRSRRRRRSRGRSRRSTAKKSTYYGRRRRLWVI